MPNRVMGLYINKSCNYPFCKGQRSKYKKIGTFFVMVDLPFNCDLKYFLRIN